MLLTARPTTMVSYAKPARVLGETALILSEGSALMKACWLGRLRLARLLIEGGTDSNKTTHEGRTALMASCMTTYRDSQTTPKLTMVKFLLRHKADPNMQDKYGKTALMYACIENAGVEVVSVLLEYDADPRTTDKRGSSALVYAINAGDSAILTLLIAACRQKGRDVIIITTKDVGVRTRETKQYLGVPPVLPGSPPFYQCITPSDIEFKTSLKSDDVKQEFKQGEDNIASPFSIAVPNLSARRQSLPAPTMSATTPSDTSLHTPALSTITASDTSVELDCWNRLGSREGSPIGSPRSGSPNTKRTPSPQLGKMPKELTPDQSSLYKRRHDGRGKENNNNNNTVPSLELLQVSQPNSPEEANDEDQTEHLYIEAPPQRRTPILNISCPDKSPSPPRIRKALIRRQSADIIRFRTMLHDIEENSHGLSNSHRLHKRFPLSEGCSPEESQSVTPVATPLLEHKEIKLPAIESSKKPKNAKRKKSLPRMPPPLRKSQTVHNIQLPLGLLKANEEELCTSARSCPDDLDAQSPRSVSAIENGHLPLSAVHNPRSPPSSRKFDDPRKRRMIQRRDSMPQLLNDKLSRQRPGTLPQLKVNPNPPIPNIGSRFDRPPVLKRQTSDVSNMSIAKAAAEGVSSVSATFDRRRMSMQVDDMRKVMDSMKAMALNNNCVAKPQIQNHVVNNNDLTVKKELILTKSL
ncbi:uncharacterized protein [Amphiura filiformis]|uniref:uncharacterized protein n=1 Tax=Amphiura filiformis TaxID=82378 RepID=UPI003B217CA9